MRAPLLFLENHDSFSHLLADALWRAGGACTLVDTYEPYQPGVFAAPYAGIVIGPGPGDERSSPNLMRYVAEAVASGLPILGVCLGMQALGVYFGAQLGTALQPVHGKVRRLLPRADSALYPGGEEGIVRYHSLILQNLPDCLLVEAASPEGECMALTHKYLPVWGVQYHPEAACTEAGEALLRRWLQFAGVTDLPLPLKQTVQPPPQLWETKLNKTAFER